VDVPVQYFQSVIAIELAVTGALLFQIRFFDSSNAAKRDVAHRHDPRVLLAVAFVLGATTFGSLWAMLHHAQAVAASAVTIGLALSVLPILVHVLPPIAKNAATQQRDPDYGVTVAGLVLYVVLVSGTITLLNA
jgi:hypothetical protein